MAFVTEEILHMLTGSISAMGEVQSIGISGGKAQLPKAGEGDIDVFIYCDQIPSNEKRQETFDQLDDVLKECKTNVFSGGHWGTGDFVTINGVETWLMYFTANETMLDIESILNGDYPDKLDNYYYPIGRCAMLANINVLFDRSGFLSSLKDQLSIYPERLAEKLVQYHADKLHDAEDFERAVVREDVLFYHFTLDIAIDHFLQALFAMNRSFFPSRKRTLKYIQNFTRKPVNCEERLLEVIRLGSCPECIKLSYELWTNLVNELQKL